MKPESLVTVGQHTTVNMFSGLVLTARQVKRVDNTRNFLDLSRELRWDQQEGLSRNKASVAEAVDGSPPF